MYFRDRRIPLRGHDPSDASGGGSVEVFSNVGDAKDEEHDEHAITSGSSALAEYDFRRDHVFLRLSRELTAAQAHEYQRVLASLR